MYFKSAKKFPRFGERCLNEGPNRTMDKFLRRDRKKIDAALV